MTNFEQNVLFRLINILFKNAKQYMNYEIEYKCNLPCKIQWY